MTTTTSKPSGKPGGLSGMLTGKTIFSILIFAIGLWFILANTESARVHIFLVTVTSPMWLVLAVMFAGGWLGGILYASRKRKRQAQQ